MQVETASHFLTFWVLEWLSLGATQTITIVSVEAVRNGGSVACQSSTSITLQSDDTCVK